MQEGRPISYFSQPLSAKNRLKPVYKRELTVIILAAKKQIHYRLSGNSIIKTDQHNLKHLLEQKQISPKYQKLLIKLIDYDFKIKFKVINQNVTAYALSQRPTTCTQLHDFISQPTRSTTNHQGNKRSTTERTSISPS